MANPKPKLSLCMIVKNEQRWIAACLESVKDHVDEMVVVDTGSTDKTPEIATAFGARVSHHPWTGNFSEARNYSLEQATGDWILVLDADEQLAKRDGLHVREIITAAVADGFLLTQRNYLWNSQVVGASAVPQDYEEGRGYTHCLDVWVMRLFRSRSSIRFRGRVHELVEAAFLENQYPFEKAHSVIHHFGKVGDPEVLEGKRHLYLELGRQKAQEEAVSAAAHFEMGIQLDEMERYAESIPYFERAYQLEPVTNSISMLYIARAYHKTGQREKAEEQYEECLKVHRDDLRVLFEMANFKRDIGQLKASRRLFMDILRQDPKHVPATYNLGGVYLRMGDDEKSFELFKKAARLNPSNEAIFEQMGKLALTGFHTEEIASLLEGFLERFSQSRLCPSLLAQISFKLKRYEGAIRWATRALEIEPQKPFNQVIRAHAQLGLGQLDGAETDYRAVLDRDSRHLDSLMNLATIAELRGDAVAAASLYREALQHSSEHPVALKRYGLILGRQSPDCEALHVLERAHRANPGDTELLLLLGFLYEKQGRAAEALVLYQDAKERNPKLSRLADQKIRRLSEESRVWSSESGVTSDSRPQTPDSTLA